MSLLVIEIGHLINNQLLWLHRSKAGGLYWVFTYVRQGKRREMGLGSFGSGTWCCVDRCGAYES